MENVRIRELVRHFQRDACAEVFRHPAGHFLHSHAARGYQKEHAVAVAFFHNPRHNRFVGFARLFVKTAVVVNYNQNRRDCPSVVVDIILKARSGEELTALIQNLTYHREKLADSIRFHIRFVHIAADMFQVGKHGEQFRAEIETVDIQHIRRIGGSEGINDRLHERGLARRNRSKEQVMSSCRKVQRNGVLRLIFRVVRHADESL